MLKKLLFSFVIIALSSNLAFAKKRKKRSIKKSPYTKFLVLAQQSYSGGKPFIASNFLKIYLMRSKKPSKSSLRLMSKILAKTNIYPFLDLPLDNLKKFGIYSNVNYLIAKKSFFLKKDDVAISYFKKVSKGSPFYLQSLMHLASLLEIKGDYAESKKYIKSCIQSSARKNKIIPLDDREIQARNRDHIYDTCRHLLPRLLYKENKLDVSLKIFDKLDHQSYLFPNALFDSSWAYLREKDYNRAVGRNITFQAPLFDDYFIPETELVKALSYLSVCDYDEALDVVKNYDKNVKTKAEEFIKAFKLNDRGDNYPYLDLVYGSKMKKKFKDNFIIKLSTVLNIKPGMHLLKHYLKNLKEEKQKAKSTIERKSYLAAYKIFSKFFNSYVKVKFVRYAKEAIRISNIFAEIELDLYSMLKHRIYDEKAGRTTKEKLNYYLKDTKRKKTEYYWDFQGEFWADELGDYIPLLNNKCKNKIVK